MAESLTKVTGIDQIPRSPESIREKMVLVPLPFCGAVKRSSLIGRISEAVESAIKYCSPEWNEVRWRSFFKKNALSGLADITPNEKYAFYRNAQVTVLDSETSPLKAVAAAYDELHPQKTSNENKRQFERSILHTGQPLDLETELSPELFRSLFKLIPYHTSKTLLEMFGYSLECLKNLRPRSKAFFEKVSTRVDQALGFERKIASMISQGRKPKHQAESKEQRKALANELKQAVMGFPKEGGALIFKGGTGASNQQMREIVHKAFIYLQTNGVREKLSELELSEIAKTGLAQATEKFGSQSKWVPSKVSAWLTDEFLPANLEQFEWNLRVSYPKLLKRQSTEEKNQTHQIMQGWEEGNTQAFEAYLEKLIINDKEKAYGHLLSDGVFERFFDEFADNIVESVHEVVDEGREYLSDEWLEGLKVFLEKGSFEKLPEDVQKWLPKTFATTLAKTIHSRLQDILVNDLFPAKDVSAFLGGVFERLDESGLENAFRLAFSEFMQTRLVDTGFEIYNSELSSVLNQLPAEARAAIGQMGIDSPETHIWYAFEKDAEGAFVLKVFNATSDHTHIEETHYAITDPKALSDEFFEQLITFRVGPRTDNIGYSLADVHAYLKQHLSEEKSVKSKTCQTYTTGQNLLFALMQEQLGLDVTKNYLHKIREQALIDMHSKAKMNSSDYAMLIEGAECLASEVNARKKEIEKTGDNQQKRMIQENFEAAFDTYWQICSETPDEKGPDLNGHGALVSKPIQEKLRSLVASLGISKKHFKLWKNTVEAAFGKEMGSVFDAFSKEILGDYRLLASAETVDLGAKIGGVNTLYTIHQVLSAYVDHCFERAETMSWKLALHTVKFVLWTSKVTTGNALPLASELTPQLIKDLAYAFFMFFLNLTLPILAKIIVQLFIDPKTIETSRLQALEYQRAFTRTGGLNFALEDDGSNHLHLLHWFRDPNDIEILEMNDAKTEICRFRFKSLNLTFNVVDGKAYVDETGRAPGKEAKFGDYYIAQDQRLLATMHAFSKYLVLENAAGQKRVILAADSLDATLGANVARTLTNQSPTPFMSRTFQAFADQFLPSYRNETAYFVYDYVQKDGRLESNNPCAMSYQLFYYVTQGEMKQAERILNELTVFVAKYKTLPKTFEPLLRRIQIFCMTQPDQRSLVLGLKLAALREQCKIEGKDRKLARLAPEDEELPWKFLDILGLQASMMRYLEMKQRLLNPPLSDAQEYRILKGTQRRLDELRKTLADQKIDELSLPASISALPGANRILGAFKHFYNDTKTNLVHLLLMPELLKRLNELEKTDSNPIDGMKAKAAFSWVPRVAIKNFIDPFVKIPFKWMPQDLTKILPKLPFEAENAWPFICDVDLDSDAPLIPSNMCKEQLHTHFLSYYRQALDKTTQKDLHKQLESVLGHFDPMTMFLLNALKIVSSQAVKAPSAQAMEDTIKTAKAGDSKDLCDQLKALKTACQKAYSQMELEQLVFELPAKTKGSAENFKAGQMSAELIQENIGQAYLLAKGRGDPETVRAFRLQIASLIDEAQSPKLRFLIICLSLVSQNPDRYPEDFDQIEVANISKKQLKASGSIDIARDIPASVLNPATQNIANSSGSWFGGLTSHLRTLGSTVFGNYTPLVQKAAHYATSALPWLTKTPPPSNALLLATEYASEMASKTSADAPALQDEINADAAFADDKSILNKLIEIDNATSEDMHKLLAPHTRLTDHGKCAFKSEKDYLIMRRNLESRMQHLDQLMTSEMQKILTLANSAPVNFEAKFTDRLTLLTQKEIFEIFAMGDQEKLQKRTNLQSADLKKLITLLLAYHQLQSQRIFLLGWQQRLEEVDDILGYRFEQKDYSFVRPINWNTITVDQFRLHLMRESFNYQKTHPVSQTELQAFKHLYPGFALRNWQDPLAKDLLNTCIQQ